MSINFDEVSDLPELCIILLSTEVLMHLVERIVHLLWYPVVHLRETTIASIITVTLKLLLHVQWQALLDVR